jgi:hypothetical protein
MAPAGLLRAYMSSIEVWQTVSYLWRAYITTATALVGGVAGIYAMNTVES